MQSEGYEAPTVMQRLAAIRMLFDWLVSGGIVTAEMRRQA